MPSFVPIMKNMNSRVGYRNSRLINTAYKKLVVPDVMSRVCNIVVSLVSSLIAARFVGTEAVSAIALMVPITLFSTCLFELLGTGISQVIIKYKSRGKADNAARAFAAITANTFFWYVVTSVVALIFSKDILRLFTDDETLIANGLRYFIPMLIGEPFCILGLCFERGFKTEGRNGFFGFRAILTNILNVVFSLVSVLVFHGGIVGIAVSGYVAGLLGYCWSFSHIFSSKCSMRPDFTVLGNRKEFKIYVVEEIKIGGVFALDDGCYAVASALMNKAYIMTGGAEGLAAFGIADAVLGVIYSVNGSIQQSLYSLSNLFYSDRDSNGSVRVLRSAVVMEIVVGLFAWLLLNLFSQEIGMFYIVDNSTTMEALKFCFCFLTVTVIADCFTNLFGAFMLSTEHTKAAARCVFIFNAVLAVSALTGFSGISFPALLCIQMIGVVIVAAMEAILIHRFNKKMPADSDAVIQMYSCTLDDNACAEISRTVERFLSDAEPFKKVASKAALLAEECSRLILYVNRNRGEQISVDLRIYAKDRECEISMVDSGDIFDPVNRLTEGELPEEFVYSKQILSGLSPEAKYTRIANLNVSHLILRLAE